jgi:predicted Fe-Mo cluster-binding NifX family protein
VSLLTSNNPTIQQSNNPTIQQSNNPTIQQSSNPTIQQSNNPTIQQSMKIAVASQNRKTIFDHAGRCRNFWIFDIKENTISGKSLMELPKEQSFHNSPQSEPHPLDEVDVLIVGGMGPGLVRKLVRKGIQGIITPEKDPEKAVQAYLEGVLETLSVGEHRCKDHHHD